MILRLASKRFVCCAAGLGFLLIQPTHAQETADAQPDGTPEPLALVQLLTERVRKVFEERKNAVVRVEAFDKHGKLCGSGFFADPAGTIYTLAAIVEHAEDIMVVHGEKKMPAKLLLADPRSGVALLKVDGFTPFIPPGDSGKLQISTPVIALGYPLDRAQCPNFGIIAGFDQSFMGSFLATTHIRANLPVQRGQGGGPLLDLEGNVVGILVASIDGGSGCFALPINAAEKIRTDYVRFGKAKHGWVGVKVEEASLRFGGSNAEVAELDVDTPAATSGLQPGDILLQVGDTPIEKPEDVLDASFFLTAGDATKISVLRNGEALEFTVRSISHPSLSAESDGQNGNQIHAFATEFESQLRIPSP